MAPTTDWNPVLRGEFDKPYWKDLMAFVQDERSRHQVFPPHDEVFTALHVTPLSEVKAVIIGQDPYHGPGQAHGLCFSVRPGVRVPPSLQNIHKELVMEVSRTRGGGQVLLKEVAHIQSGKQGSFVSDACHQSRNWIGDFST